MCVNVEVRGKRIVMATLNADNTNKLIVHFIPVDIPCIPQPLYQKKKKKTYND
jgi:hypothetical protein